MPNRSKINDPRFWEIWRRSGAVAKKEEPAKIVAPIIISEHELALAQKAFALAINKQIGFLKPHAGDVVVTPGVLCHRCEWSNGDGLGERFEIHGSFYHRELEPDNQGAVCIAAVYNDSGYGGFPHDWHFLFFICEEYEQMENAPSKSDDDETCPSCFMVGRVGENHIGGGAEFGVIADIVTTAAQHFN